MKLYTLAFSGMNESEVGKIVVNHGGRVYATHKCYVAYLATEKSDTEIILDLVSRGLLD